MTPTDIRGNDGNLSEGCHTCLAIPAHIVEISSQHHHSALVDALGVRRLIDVTLLQEDKPAPGDWVLIHVGFAMAKISEQDALDRLRTMELLGETQAAAREICSDGMAADDSASSIE